MTTAKAAAKRDSAKDNGHEDNGKDNGGGGTKISDWRPIVQ